MLFVKSKCKYCGRDYTDIEVNENICGTCGLMVILYGESYVRRYRNAEG